MKPSRRTQSERTAATRGALVASGRRLFGAEGYASVGTERVVADAGVSRGALYHQFGDKAGLFAAVLDEVEAELTLRIAGAVTGLDPADTQAVLMAGAEAWLDASVEPEIQRIVLIDGPSVLGWDGWREICLPHSVGLVAALLSDGIERGAIPRQPVEPLTHALIGAVNEAALYVARAPDPQTARTDMNLVLRRLAAAITMA